MKRLVAYDFDATLMNTPSPEEGVKIYQDKKGVKLPEGGGWWGRPESLDTDVFDIKPFPTIEERLRKDMSDPDTHVIILTNRRNKLRSEVKNVLDVNNIQVDDIVMDGDTGEDKGGTLLQVAIYTPELEEITVYDDMRDGEPKKLKEFTRIKNELPDHIKFNIYFVRDGKLILMESYNILHQLIMEEIIKLNS